MEEDYPSIPMERTRKIIRRSIYTFLQNYSYYTTTAALLALPFSASILLSQALVPSSSVLPPIHHRLASLFHAAGFPPSSEFFTILSLKLSQTITSSIVVLPFTLSLLLIAKASIIQSFSHQKQSVQTPFSQFISLYSHLLHTQVWNSFVILSANATCFAILFFAFNFLDGFALSSPTSLLFLSASGAVLYSIILANALIICNMALVLSGIENCGGYISILKACVLIRGRTATALSLALPVNMALAAVEALFQYRVVRAYHHTDNLTTSMAFEGMFIAYLYSILIVLDTVIGCVFFQSCKSASSIDQERRISFWIEIEEGSANSYQKAKILQELP
ncbi:unnamed protein product [Ilex paraguariensis]|uniref:Uncharacterized protein n=1 Tax=Ilex paraguariensis TaxID=185542 RepID=A0ABC8RV94_9AQUA